MLKSIWYLHAVLVVMKVIAYLVLHTGYFYILKFEEFRHQFIHFVDEIFIDFFFLIVHKKSLNIPDDKKEDISMIIINFYVLCLLLVRNLVYEI
jgi:hypothetical protein